VRFVFSGDTAGQGWGINLATGGMRLYGTMRAQEPDFFIHSGDNIYADGVMVPSVTLPDGTIWTNAFLDEVPAKLKVAETLNEYRANYLYNLHDANVVAFNADVPQIWQWDDHETLNNWSPGKDLSADARYTEKRILTLAARAKRAFLEYSPQRWHGQDESERVYRLVPYGRELDVLMLDMRSYAPPTASTARAAGRRHGVHGAHPDRLAQGEPQAIAARPGRSSAPTCRWVCGGRRQRRAGRPQFENSANGDGPVLGREFEIAEILSFIKREKIRNVVWLTADVHYARPTTTTRARRSSPTSIPSGSSSPVRRTPEPSVPIRSTTLRPAGGLPEGAAAGQSNLAPSAGYQFFGQIDIDARSHDLVLQLKDTTGSSLFTQRSTPIPSTVGATATERPGRQSVSQP